MICWFTLLVWVASAASQCPLGLFFQLLWILSWVHDLLWRKESQLIMHTTNIFIIRGCERQAGIPGCLYGFQLFLASLYVHLHFISNFQPLLQDTRCRGNSIILDCLSSSHDYIKSQSCINILFYIAHSDSVSLIKPWLLQLQKLIIVVGWRELWTGIFLLSVSLTY